MLHTPRTSSAISGCSGMEQANGTVHGQASNPSFESTLDSDHLPASVARLTSHGTKAIDRRCYVVPAHTLVVHLFTVAYGGDGHHRIAFFRPERVGPCSGIPHNGQEVRAAVSIQQKCAESVRDHGRDQTETVQESQWYAAPPSYRSPRRIGTVLESKESTELRNVVLISSLRMHHM